MEHLEYRCNPTGIIGGIDLGDLPNYLFFFANGSQDANWQSASKGYVGDVAINGQLASERTSGTIAYDGTIFTNDSTLGAWQKIVNDNPGQAAASTGNTGLIADLSNHLNAAFSQINGLAVTPGFADRSSTSLNNLNTENGIAETIVINVNSGFQVTSKINITGDASDVFVLRWDSDSNFGNGYHGQVKFQSGGAIVPLGGLTAGNFIHVAGNINASGGGSNPSAPFPQGPRLDDGTGALINGGKDFSGGGFFTGYWLTTGDPSSGDTSSLSNAIFVGGWYTLTDKFSMTSGTSGIHVSPNPATQLASISGSVYKDLHHNGRRDSFEPGIANVQITLTGTDDQGNAVTRITFTDNNGNFRFDNLAAGTYELFETQPNGYRDGEETVGTVDGSARGQLLDNDLIGDIVLEDGEHGIGYDFGELFAGS
jgi:hypothetical protein